MKIEQLDDLPLLGSQFTESNLTGLLDEYFPDHGHWLGISGGKLALGWLLYILSEGDHRLSYVQDWAESRIEVLSSILEAPELRALDFSDDRLGRLLDRYQDEITWQRFEKALGQTLLQVYDLDVKRSCTSSIETVRTDSFNVPQFRDPGELFRYGYSKQRRADQPFCKVMMAALDSCMVPLAVDVIKGSGPDVDHYLPVIQRSQSVLGRSGHLYVADAQLCSLSNRSWIHQHGDYYLCPLGRKQCSLEQLHDYLNQFEDAIEELPALFTAPESKRKTAYYYQVQEEITDPETGGTWKERRILVYAPDYAKGLVESFESRLIKAQENIQNLVISKQGRRNPKILKDLHTRIDGIIKKFQVEECFTIDCFETIERGPKQPLNLTIQREEETIALKRSRLGWQVYASNVEEDKLSTAELVTSYRDEYRIEHLFNYMLNRDVGLLPVYLKKEGRVKGLIHLLSIAMKFSMSLQYQVRKSLAQEDKKLSHIYPGNKGRKTELPTTSMLLRIFRAIAIVWITVENNKVIQMTPLNDIQSEILNLLGIQNVYHDIVIDLQTRFSLRET